MYPPPTPGSYALIDPGVGGGHMGVLVKLSPYFYLKMLGVYAKKQIDERLQMVIEA